MSFAAPFVMMDLCDMVAKAWETITQETIAKSFKCCGQARDSKPEDITCLKKGRTAEDALNEVTDLWDKDPESLKDAILDTVPDEEEDEANEIVIFDD